jgi:uncharacterized protein YjbK
MSKTIQFKNEGGKIVITIPNSLIKWAAENNPETPMIVNDEDAFAKKVMFELKHNLGSDESGLTGFQKLLDEAMIAVLENGDESVEFNEQSSFNG